MVDKIPVPPKTTEELVRKLPGFKPIPPKVEKDENGDPIPPPEPVKSNDPVMPHFKVDFKQPVIRDSSVQMRRDQTAEIQSLRDYLSKTHAKQIATSDKKTKSILIPAAKTLERAILLPQELAYDIKDKKYPETGNQLMINPFAKKKKTKGKKGKGKKGRR